MSRAIGYRHDANHYVDPAWEIRWDSDGEIHVHTGAERLGGLRPPWIHEADWRVEGDLTYCAGGCGMGGTTIYAPVHTCPKCGHQFEEEQ